MPKKQMIRYRKRNARNKPRKTLPMAGFPNNKMVKMRYVDEVRVATNLGSAMSKSVPFVANGLFDPYYPIGGHQPKGFDQWMAVYNHYNVVGAKITVRLASTQANNVAWGVCRTPITGTMNGISLTQCLENRYQRNVRYLSFNNGVNTNQNNRPLTASYSQKKQFGNNSAQKGDLTGNAAKNPDEGQYFEIWVAPVQGDTNIKTLDFVVTVDYIALFTEPKVLAQS